LKHGEKGTAGEQFAAARGTAERLVRILKGGGKMVVTHGNGPQVGDILLKNEFANEVVPPMPLDVCGAESQGMIGYMLQQALEAELASRGIKIPVATVLTQVLVDRADPAFDNPSKPVGPYYSQAAASKLKQERRWKFAKEAGRGYRRVVPSPSPLDILEKDTITSLFRSGTLVIAAGGGGIPVVRLDNGTLVGVEAVLDKDRTAALLARDVGTRVLLILTDVDGVYLNYDRPDRRLLTRLSPEECELYLGQGVFPPGSMGPKIESAVRFLREGGEKVVITSMEQAEQALRGESGTTIAYDLSSSHA